MAVNKFGQDKQWRNGMVRRRYQVTLTDNTGVDHVTVTRAVVVDPSDDGATVESEALVAYREGEIEEFLNAVTAGTNPFGAERWNDRAVLLKAILDQALSRPATDTLVLNGLPYLDNVSDAELMALYGQDQTWVDDVRSKQVALLSSKSGLDAYQPVLGSE